MSDEVDHLHELMGELCPYAAAVVRAGLETSPTFEQIYDTAIGMLAPLPWHMLVSEDIFISMVSRRLRLAFDHLRSMRQ